jgi:hypothetical protein
VPCGVVGPPDGGTGRAGTGPPGWEGKVVPVRFASVPVRPDPANHRFRAGAGAADDARHRLPAPGRRPDAQPPPLLHRREPDPCASIEFTRGCPWDCSFCSAWTFYGRSYRKASPEAAAEDLARIREPSVFIVDDVAFIKPDHGNAIAAEVERRGIRKQYCLETRSDVLKFNTRSPTRAGHWPTTPGRCASNSPCRSRSTSATGAACTSTPGRGRRHGTDRREIGDEEAADGGGGNRPEPASPGQK